MSRRYVPPVALLPDPDDPGAFVGPPWRVAARRYAAHVDRCDKCSSAPVWYRPESEPASPACGVGRRLLHEWDQALVRSIDTPTPSVPVPEGVSDAAEDGQP